jgi:hypothetical protein
MRLPGAWHFSWDPEARQIRPNGQSVIVANSGHRYDADLFDDLLPRIELDPPGLPLLNTSTELPPRPPEQLLDAMQKVPEFHHGEGRYDELLKLAKRLHVELGRDAAFHLLRAHSPHVKDMAAYFTKAPDRISPGSIWPFLRDQYGIDIRRHDLKAATAANSSPGPLQDSPPASGDGTPTAAGNGRGKRRTLAPDEVLQLLPERLGGTPRLNIRTNAFHAGGTIYTADDLARVYLHLSSETERWTKEATCDAAVELAKNRAFDPVEEELNQIARATQPLDDEHWQRLDHHLLGIDDPTVGILTIGEEAGKGTDLVQEAYALLEGTPGFVGNIEGRDIPRGTARIIVTDGFTGNVALKLYEGTAAMIFHEIRRGLTSSLRGKIAGALGMPVFKDLRKHIDPEEYGGAYLLGVRGISVIGHGNSGTRGMTNGILRAARGVTEDVTGHIEAGLGAVSTP